MKSLIPVCLLFLLITASGQEKINKTSTITITGEIKNNLQINDQDLLKFPVHEIGDLVIKNHLGELKGTHKKLKGVLLKDVLANLEFNSPSPRLLSEYYLTVVASDGYKVVFSWNELFNSPSGNNIYLITEKEGITIDKMDESILLVTTTDFKTGRRNVKAVERINIGRIK
jgi:hypothetical protein